MRWILRSLYLLLEAIIATVVIGGCALWFDMRLTPPLGPGEQVVLPDRVPDGDRAWRVGPDRLAQNDRGIWEAYVAGPDLERGLTYGALAQDLIERQEEFFVDRIRLLVPDETKLGWLRYGVAFFDRDIEDNIPLEFRREIYGESRSFSDAFDFIAPKYDRALNYHAAHDIGHALQDLALVGCTSFAVWGDRTADGKLLVGRNFDFYMGEDFACDKVVLFMRPEHGHPFAEITWGGMMGAVSGMNLEGLTVTINAARSAIPVEARTPISLLAREILQYASTIDEAIAIAKARDVFVSEAILVSSAKDGRAVVIEKAPDGMGVFDPDSGAVVCANHYQSAPFRDSPPNLENIRESDSMGRFRRMWDLLNTHPHMGPMDAAAILRDRMGPQGRPVGFANPMAIDQMIAHHSVVFQPEDGRMWLSVGPYQLGEYLCYDLPAIFAAGSKDSLRMPLYDPTRTLPADSFLTSPHMDDLVWHRAMRTAINDRMITGRPFALSPEQQDRFIATDPDNYITYMTLGDVEQALGHCEKAVPWFRIALEKEVASENERQRLHRSIAACAKN
ncbi:MAG: hypothetical protein H6594_06925 [Flavobacteriales bacterium]|nr:hypothetical protein [Flavobacteriales bacterium]